MKKFLEPEIEVRHFDITDVITTSYIEDPNVGNPTPED